MKFISYKEKRNYYIVNAILNKLEVAATWKLKDDYILDVWVEGVGNFSFNLEQPQLKSRLLNILRGQN